ncbi:MAG TPA: hypothetical protein VHC19_28915 [Pirellulales bacterium]|nr:hypothetical protein [Pirellulales bacterium]
MLKAMPIRLPDMHDPYMNSVDSRDLSRVQLEQDESGKNRRLRHVCVSLPGGAARGAGTVWQWLRRGLRFRLRTLLTLLIACAIASSTFGVRWLNERRQREAVDKLGLVPAYEDRNVVGLDVLPRKMEGLLDDRLQELKRLPHLRRLSLRRLWITDAGLAHLSELTELEELRIGLTLHYDPEVDPRELIGSIYRGRSLDIEEVEQKLRADLLAGTLLIRNTSITDEGVLHLVHIKSLRVLSLEGTSIGDRGLARLASLPLLEELDLQNTCVTDDGLKSLASFPRLERLKLGGMRFATCQGLRHVVRIRTLRELQVPDDTDDEAMLMLLPLKNSLRRLDVSRSQITIEGVRELQAALPECEIDTFGSRPPWRPRKSRNKYGPRVD